MKMRCLMLNEKSFKKFLSVFVIGALAISLPLNANAKRIHDSKVTTKSEARQKASKNKTVTVKRTDSILRPEITPHEILANDSDIIIAEQGARIGFAGRRVIEQTIGQKLPQGFQRAEYLEEHGFVDQIVSRAEMRTVLDQILRLHEKKRWPL